MAIASKYPAIVDWVNKNPSGYMVYTFREIAKQLDMSYATVNLWLPRIIANREGIMPSEVRRRRTQSGFNRQSIPIEKQKRILELDDQGATKKDIACLLDINQSTVYRYLKKAGRVKATK